MTVRTHCHNRRFNSGIPCCFNCICRAFKATGAAGCNVDTAASLRKLKCFAEDILITSTVRRTNVTNRETAVNDFFEHLKCARNIAKMDMKNTDLSGNHAAYANLCQEVENILCCREGGAMVAQCDLNA